MLLLVLAKKKYLGYIIEIYASLKNKNKTFEIKYWSVENEFFINLSLSTIMFSAINHIISSVFVQNRLSNVRYNIIAIKYKIIVV